MTAADWEVGVAFDADLCSDLPSGYASFPVRGIGDVGSSGPAPGMALIRAATEFRADLVHLNNVRSPSALSTAAAHFPTLLTVHDHVLTCPALNRLSGGGSVCERAPALSCLGRGCRGLPRWPHLSLARVQAALARSTAAAGTPGLGVTVASGFMKRILAASGIPADRVEVLPYYIDLPDSPPLEADGRSGGEILFAGRLVEPDKGPSALIDVLVRLPEARCSFAGDGAAAAELRLEALSRGVADRARFLGWLEPCELATAYARASVLALPSIWPEPFGIVGIEAMARELPVVAYDSGGVGEWLEDGRTGLLVPRGDHEALARAVGELIVDRPRAEAMGRAARERVRQSFSREACLGRWMDAFRRSREEWRPSESRPRTRAANRRAASGKPTLALFSTFRPYRSGISDYSEELAEHLADHFSLTFVVGDEADTTGPHGPGSVLSQGEFRGGFDLNLYQLGSNPGHAFLYDLCLEHPGVVDLHDWSLHDLTASRFAGERRRFLREFVANEGLRGLVRLVSGPGDGTAATGPFGKARHAISVDQARRERFPLNRRLIRSARGIVVHSPEVAMRVSGLGPRGPVRFVPHGIRDLSVDRTPAESRARLGLDAPGIGPSTFVLLSFGFIQKHKRIPQCLESFRLFRQANPESLYILLGPRSPEYDLDADLDRLGLRPHVLVLDGYPEMDVVCETVNAADLCLALRGPSYGGMSGALLKMMVLGKPCLASPVDELRHLPADVLRFIETGEDEVRALAAAMEEMWRFPREARRLGERARSFVRQGRLWPEVVRSYVEFLKTFL